MNNEKLLEELKPYSVKELELIASTQKDLYSPEEMEVIKNLIAEKKGETPPVGSSRQQKTDAPSTKDSEHLRALVRTQMMMYQELVTIRNWVKFFGILTIIGLCCGFIISIIALAK